MAWMPDIEAEIRRDWEQLRGTALHITHASQAPAVMPVTVDTTTAKEQPMGFVTDVKSELAAAAHDLAAHAVQFDQNVLPGLAGKLTALEGNPVVDAVLAAAHVPPEALDIVVKTIEGLEALYNPAQPAQAPVAAQ